MGRGPDIGKDVGGPDIGKDVCGKIERCVGKIDICRCMCRAKFMSSRIVILTHKICYQLLNFLFLGPRQR